MNLLICIVLAVPFCAIFGGIFWNVFVLNKVYDGSFDEFVGDEPSEEEFE